MIWEHTVNLWPCLHWLQQIISPERLELQWMLQTLVESYACAHGQREILQHPFDWKGQLDWQTCAGRHGGQG